jgi:hypothetical protein
LTADRGSRLLGVRKRVGATAALILAAVENRFGVLRRLTDLEQQLVADARSGWNEPLAERLRAEIREQ